MAIDSTGEEKNDEKEEETVTNENEANEKENYKLHKFCRRSPQPTE